MSIFEELKRRNVFRVGAAYAVAGWLIMQVVDIFAPALLLPDWFPTGVAFLLLIGFPIAMFFSWAYEITPEGIKKEIEVDHSASVTHETAAKLDRITISLLVLVIAMFAVDRFFPGADRDQPTTVSESETSPVVSQSEPIPASDGRQSVAVLPFVNMSDDEQNEYFSDGISEELLNVLVKIESLRVPSRTSSFTFKGSDMKLSDIGRELGVDNVLEGSVRKAGSQIRVTAQLIDVETDTHLWSDTYTRELDDIFAVQDEISSAIVQALQVTLSGEDEQNIADHGTTNVDAYNKYLLGRHLWNKRGAQPLLDAIEPLKEAVALDPEYDEALAALAETYVLIPEYGAGEIDEYIPLGRDATERALHIAPDSARALTARGYIKAMYEYDIEGALADFVRAIELDPKYPTAHQWYGEILSVIGRVDDALEQVRIAKELDPLATIIHHVEGWILDHEGQYEAAIEAYNSVHRIDPYIVNTYGNLGFLYARMGEYDKAHEMESRVGELTGVDVSAVLLVYDALKNPALKPDALQALQESDFLRDGASFVTHYYMLLGERELTLDSLERGFEQGDPYAIHMGRFEIYDPLHDEPRFQALLRKMNLLQ